MQDSDNIVSAWPQRTIGEYNTCPHLCEYCYANTSKEIAIANWKKHENNPYAETITGK